MIVGGLTAIFLNHDNQFSNSTIKDLLSLVLKVNNTKTIRLNFDSNPSTFPEKLYGKSLTVKMGVLV